jgi:hypothetical protein
LFDDDRLHLTEKSLRPIACKQPFILAATHGSLQYLKDYGFKTFDSVWDENYDTIEDPYQRMLAIIQLMKNICAWTPEEKISKMQSEQMPALLDTIRDQIGSEQSEAFKSAVGSTLQTLMDNLQAAREGVDNGVRVLSGEQVDQQMAMPGDAELPPAPASDLDQEEGDAFSATDAAVGGTEELGREQR